MYSISKPFTVVWSLGKLHPRLTNSDLMAIKTLKESGDYDNWNDLFKVFLASIGVDVPAVL